MDRIRLHSPHISVIVPVWGDDKPVCDLVSGDLAACPGVEWIVAAVNPEPCLRALTTMGQITIVECPHPSRGEQMNAGAAIAHGTLLCFNHADTMLTLHHIASLAAAAADGQVVGGAFHRRFDDRHRWMQRLEKTLHRLDCGYGPFFGDQSIFVRRDVFQQLGGFADIPLMEDIEFSRRLKKAGRVKLLHPPIWSSPRRFRRLGNWRSTAFNALLIGLYYLGVSPQSLHRWYYAGRVTDSSVARPRQHEVSME